MPVYTEMVNDKKTGKMIEKKVRDGKQKQYYIRTYVTDEFGKRKKITKHNKNWIGRDGYWEAVEEENNLKKKINGKSQKIKLNELVDDFLLYKKTMVKLSTYLKYSDDINNHILPYFKNIEVKKINVLDILHWQNNINEKKISITVKKNYIVHFLYY